MPEAAPRVAVPLAGEVDVEGYRQAVRRLVAAGVAPERIDWQPGAPGLLDAEPLPDAAPAPPLALPAAYVSLAESALLHRDADRHALLYRLAWRLLHEPGLRHDRLDADWVRGEDLARTVRREIHKAHAFVRFRALAADAGDAPLHIAWFEPAHHIVEALAPYFAQRFGDARWALLTPERSVRGERGRYAFGPGAQRADAPAADAGEALWLTYYAHIFNPARLKLDAMRKEMPRRYWPHLPEAALIAPLAAAAGPRSAAMLARPAAQPARKRPQAAAARVVPDSAEGRPTAAAEGAPTLEALRALTDRCRECPIGAHATQSVFGEGPIGARLMLVGEQPGDQEDLRGRPFVGPAGQLLDRALAALQWPREQLYVTNAVKHFKFELRGTRRLHKTPGQREVAACQHWLEAEIERVRPQAAVALGATAARALLGRQVAVLAHRGQWLDRPDGLRVLVTLHPSALLRGEPSEREQAYAAWLADLRHADAAA